MPDKKIEYVDFEIYLGTFNDNEFTWHRISKHKDFEQAYKEFKTWDSLYEYDKLKGIKVIEKGEPLFMRKDIEEELEYLRS